MSIPLTEAWRSARQACAWLRGELDDLYAMPTNAVDAAAARHASPQAPRGEVVAALRAMQPRLGPGQARSLETLATPEAVAVVTGQQPGLCGGPLYALLKAVGAVVMAARLTAAGTPAVPLFWIATEDDDFEEVRHLDLVGRDDAPRRITVEADGDEDTPVGLRRLLTDPREELAGLIAGAPWAEWLLDTVVAGFYPGATLGEGFGRMLGVLLGEHGLLAVDSAAPELRRIAAPFYERALADPLAPTVAANHIGGELARRGFPVPTHRQPDLCPFFVLRDGRRRRVRMSSAGLTTEDGGRLDAIDPSQLSASLLLRPVLQDYLFPTAAFCVGPGEIAYLAQLRPTYDALGVAPPWLVPRFSATVLEPRPARHLAEYGLSPPDLWQPTVELAKRLSRERNGAGVAELAARVAADVDRAVAPLVAEAEAIDSSLAPSAATRRHRVRGEIARLEAKIQKSLRRRDDVLARRVALMEARTAPGGRLQERALGAAHLLADYGPLLVERLLEASSHCPANDHAVVRIDQ